MSFELKRWKEKYTFDAAAFLSDDSVISCMNANLPSPLASGDAAAFINQRLMADDEREFSRAIIIDGHACGCIHLSINQNTYARTGSITFWISADHRSEGIMTAALRQFAADAFDRYDLVRIAAFPFAENTAARCVLNNCGFDREATLAKAACKDGKMHDLCVYARFCD